MEQRVSKTFPVGGVPRVRVETFDGSITVRTWDKPEVALITIKRARDEWEMRGINLRAEQNGSEVFVSASFDKAFSREATFNGQRVLSNSASADLEVYVPRNVNLHATSGDGGIRAEGMTGDLKLRTEDGSIEASNVHSRLQARTDDGQIDITDFEGEADARTNDGPINLAGRFTQLKAWTKDGEISLTLPVDVNATIETRAGLVSNRDGVATAESVGNSSPNVKHWRVGNGGSTFELGTEKGSIYLRRAAVLGALR